jgi:putative transposase
MRIMLRMARTVIPEVPHHVTQRGNNRQDLFFVPDDYGAYPRILAEQSDRCG